MLLVAVEDNPSRIYRINPQRADAVTGLYAGILELNVSDFLSQNLGTKATYAIVAYNNMTLYKATGDCSALLMGLEVATPEVPEAFYRHNPKAYYLVRDCRGAYTLHQIRDTEIEPQPLLVSVRTIAVSPFPDELPGTIYAGGFDANSIPVHNTAWLYKGIPITGQ